MPWLLLIPAAGVVAAIALWPKPAKAAEPSATETWKEPPPGPTATTTGGARARRYLSRLTTAQAAYQAVKLIGGTTAASALAQLKGTLDVVGEMAKADAAADRITAGDLDAINAKIAELKAQIG